MLKNIELNPEFKNALDYMENSYKNLFITGRAGTGKSTLLEYFRSITEKDIVVLAPTGVAAVNISGQTIHSFFGFQPDITVEKAKRIAKRNKQSIFNNLDAIVIDEISMVRADLLDCIDQFLRIKGRMPGLPFGGIQMIFVGDLYQIPPVVVSHDRYMFQDQYDSEYFFHSRAYSEIEFKHLELEKIYRQTDQEFIDILSRIRNNTASEEDLARLNSRVVSDSTELPKGVIYLTTTNALAKERNYSELQQLEGEPFFYHAEIRGDINSKSYPAEEIIELKKDAQVILLNNDSAGRWINGTIGKVIHLEEEALELRLNDGSVVEVNPHNWNIYSFYWDEENGKVEAESVGSFKQFPLKIAWAITIHKSQGKTFDSVAIDLGRGAFASGQLYVALSRCRSLQGIYFMREIRESDILVDYRVVNYLTGYQYDLSEEKLPLDSKVKYISDAIENGEELEIVYLKNTDEKTERVIRPESVGVMNYRGRSFLGMSAYCCQREEVRNFRVDRILQVKSGGTVCEDEGFGREVKKSAQPTGIAGCIDVETTGLSAYTDEIVELALVLFSYDESSITGISDSYCGLREPYCEISSDAYDVHGLGMSDLAGQRLDTARVKGMIEKADFLVAHNANFDRGFVTKLLPSAKSKRWYCSMSGIRWSGGKGLQAQLERHNIRPDQKHRALDDVMGVLDLLRCFNQRGETYFAEMMSSKKELMNKSVKKIPDPTIKKGTRKSSSQDVFKRDEYMGLIPDIEALKVALLKVIAGNEGQITSKEAYSKVMILFPKFEELYKKQHTPGEKVYWESRVKSTRQKLVSEGLIGSDTPAGLWVITEEGKKYIGAECKQELKQGKEIIDKHKDFPQLHYIKCPSCAGEIASTLIKCIYCQAMIKKIDNKDITSLKYETIEWNDGTYTGEIIDEKPCGHGNLKMSDGTTFAGSWIEGELEGKGKITYSNGNIYEGFCKCNQPNGKGKMVFSDGSIYKGYLKNGLPNGSGILAYSNGDKYSGEFKNGKRDGLGTLVRRNGARQEGEWKGNKLKEKLSKPDNTKSVSSLKDNAKHKKVEISTSEGSKFSGKYESGKLIQKKEIKQKHKKSKKAEDNFNLTDDFADLLLPFAVLMDGGIMQLLFDFVGEAIRDDQDFKNKKT